MIDINDIDILMRDLIVALNSSGYMTMACCQGRRHLSEFDESKHNPSAYVAFSQVMSEDKVSKLIDNGFVVYGDNQCVTAISCSFAYREASEKYYVEDWKSDTDKFKVINANEKFIPCIFDIFCVK